MPITFGYRPPAINGLAAMEAAKIAGEDAGAEVLLRVSQPLVPVDTGELKDSGRVEPSKGEGAAVVYEAYSADGYDYAIKQHEDYTLNHPNGGQSHFLADPMDTEHAAIAEAAFIPIRKVLG